eukprot:1982510-Rhodomonas_salina.3
MVGVRMMMVRPVALQVRELELKTEQESVRSGALNLDQVGQRTFAVHDVASLVHLLRGLGLRRGKMESGWGGAFGLCGNGRNCLVGRCSRISRTSKRRTLRLQPRPSHEGTPRMFLCARMVSKKTLAR